MVRELREGGRSRWAGAGIIVLAACLIASNAPAADGAEALAKQILDATGVRGGLIVHVGSGDGKLTAALRASESYMVHGLDGDAANVAKARKHIQSLGIYGKVSVDRWSGGRLPYAENLVNLVVAEDLGAAPMADVMRVLCPNGVAYVKKGGEWTKTVKPRPEEIDEWTHYWHDASGNAVAQDTVVGPPRRMQWVGSPRWSRHHDHMASMSALVSSGGRIFYIIDEGPTSSIRLPGKWSLVARDAFNGTILWKRPIPVWNTHLWGLKSGPAHMPRRLISLGDRVYVTLGLDAPVTELDAATGETLRTFAGSKCTAEMVAADGVLYLMINPDVMKHNNYRQKGTYVWDNTKRSNSGWAWNGEKRVLQAVSLETGKALWKKQVPVAHMSVAVGAQGVLFCDGEKIICLGKVKGGEKWRSLPVGLRMPMHTSYGPRLVAYKDVVLFSGGKGSMGSYDAATGKRLWVGKHAASGHQSPQDLLVVGGLVWSGAIANGKDSGVFVGRDPRTGEVVNQFAPDVNIYWFHHRCHASKATEKFLLPSRTGIEFIDPTTNHWDVNHWVRGGCIYGIMPCNGMVYAPPHSCACYIESKQYGFNALAPERTLKQELAAATDEGRLEQGPAYGKIDNRQSTIDNPADWPTYRHDASRSGYTKTSVPASVDVAWKAELGGKLSSVVIAGGKLFVASIDTHTVHALDEKTGEVVWSFTAGGRIDSPPTIHEGAALFGSADGWVYCVRAADGKLAWRFRAAPMDRRITAWEQVESTWPVHGSVLVQGGIAYCVAGRSVFLDGGMRLLRLDPKTGKKLSETVLDNRDPNTNQDLHVHVKGLDMPVALPDVLSSDGKSLYMRSQAFDLQGKQRRVAPIDVTEQAGEGAHLFSGIGFLDDSIFHRAYWMYGRVVASGYGGWFKAGRLIPWGRPLVVDETTVYGYGRRPEFMVNSSVLEYQLYAADKTIRPEPIRKMAASEKKINAASKQRNASSSDWKLRQRFGVSDLSAVKTKWVMLNPPLHARAMVLAGKTLFVAGPPDVVDEEQAFLRPDDASVRAKIAGEVAALDGEKGALMWAMSASTGRRLALTKLDALPVWDGLAAANGRLFLSTKAGEVICFGKSEGAATAPRPVSDVKDSASRLGLARSYLTAGKRDKAIAILRSIMLDYPDSLDARDARAKLRELGATP